MSSFLKRKVETRFARRAAMGRGVGVEDAVASAEARLEAMGDAARESITATLDNLQRARAAITALDPAAMARVWAQADSLAGVAGVFGMPEVGRAAKSLCQLFDAASPAAPSADAVCVHLDAFRVFQTLSPAAKTSAAPIVLAGLEDVVATELRRHAPTPSA